jgi:hypothetical protein
VAASIALPLVAAAAIYLAVGYSVGTRFGDSGNPSTLIRAGERYAAPDLLPSGAILDQGDGYDGQFFFYIAQDPLLTGKVAHRDDESSPHIDAMAYRYQRILLPAIGWLTSWGDPDVLQWTLPLINLLAILGAGFLLARFLAERGRSPWLSLVYMVSIGVLSGFVSDVSDPLAASLFLAGVIWWVDRRTALAVAALTACLLARETYLIPVAVVAGLELARRRRDAAAWVIPFAVWGAWQLYLGVVLATSVTSDSSKPSVVPLLGALRKVHEVVRHDVTGTANWEIAFVALVLLVTLYFLVKSLAVLQLGRRLRTMPTREELLPVVALASAVLIPFLTVALWGYVFSYVRYAAAVPGILVLVYARSRDREAQVLMTALVVMTLANPVIAFLPIAHGPVLATP